MGTFLWLYKNGDIPPDFRGVEMGTFLWFYKHGDIPLVFRGVSPFLNAFCFFVGLFSGT